MIHATCAPHHDDAHKHVQLAAVRVDYCFSAAVDACMRFIRETQTMAHGNEDPRGLF
jgi:hypothetical protein